MRNYDRIDALRSYGSHALEAHSSSNRVWGVGACRTRNCASALRAALTLSALALTGCAHTRYVETYCATPEQYQQLKAAEPQKVGSKLTGQAQDDLKTIAGSNVELRSWGEGLLGVIGGCTGK